MNRDENYYVSIKWMITVLLILSIVIYNIFNQLFLSIFSFISDDRYITDTIILFLTVGFFCFMLATWFTRKIESIHNKLFWEQNRLKAIFIHTSDGIIVLDEDCVIHELNPAAEKLTGWKAKDVIGMHCEEVMGCQESKNNCWNSIQPEICMSIDCGHRECWGKSCLDNCKSIPFVEMCILTKNKNKIKVAASYSYIPARGAEKPQVKIVLRDITERKQFERAIQNYATLEERYRLAREMHDGLAQTLLYLNLRSYDIEKKIEEKQYDKAYTNIKEFRKITQKAADEIRQDIYDLKTTPEEKSSCFKVWLKEYLNDFGSANNINTDLQSNCSSELILPSYKKMQMIRIVQEALRNVRKHACAKNVAVKLDISEGEMSLQILDDGHGIDFDSLERKQQNHFGLAVMRERAEIIGGTLQIESNKPHGTLIRLVISI